MKVSERGIQIIKRFESLSLKAYPDPGSGGDPWTIGYGNTYYEDGKRVKKGDVITIERADRLLRFITDRFSISISFVVKTQLSQNQFDALSSFVYNIGIPNFRTSTLLKKVNINPNDTSIADEFAKWVRASGKVLPGLVKRRRQEYELYKS